MISLMRENVFNVSTSANERILFLDQFGSGCRKTKTDILKVMHTTCEKWRKTCHECKRGKTYKQDQAREK